jgi:hypothetical protein
LSLSIREKYFAHKNRTKLQTVPNHKLLRCHCTLV